MNDLLKKYVHTSWDDISECRSDKYYFVKIIKDIEQQFSEVQYQLEVELPEELKSFYADYGFVFLLFNIKQKKGLYRILSPEEILDLYFEPEIEGAFDDFITYREMAWRNLEENKLIAFCLFGEEDSLLYISAEDGAIYYLSNNHKIADSLYNFLYLLDKKVDCFIK